MNLRRDLSLTGGARILNDDVVDYLQISSGVIDSITEIEERELVRRRSVPLTCTRA